ncbi:MAG TPA: class I SAM-dependent methyltransferase, partial [Candidatus Dormibacteraeota bacterium]|nr:class I SAM-dependent methyltransferase [Candidatus Dormibacteraeota bacterium]
MSSARPVANVDMARIWDGDEGDGWTEDEERYNAAAARFDAPLFDAAAIAAADAVLDLGCGCGATTREAARRAHAGNALGVDLSARMVERAAERARAEGLDNVRFEQADAQVHRFAPESVDVAISRFGAMFFADPLAAFTNLAAALRPGGRLVLLTWQELRRNPWVGTIRDAFAMGRALPEPVAGHPGPFGLSDPEGAARILRASGFDSPAAAGYEAPLRIGADVDDAIAFVRRMGVTRGMLDG